MFANLKRAVPVQINSRSMNSSAPKRTVRSETRKSTNKMISAPPRVGGTWFSLQIETCGSNSSSRVYRYGQLS